MAPIKSFDRRERGASVNSRARGRSPRWDADKRHRLSYGSKSTPLGGCRAVSQLQRWCANSTSSAPSSTSGPRSSTATAMTPFPGPAGGPRASRASSADSKTKPAPQRSNAKSAGRLWRSIFCSRPCGVSKIFATKLSSVAAADPRTHAIRGVARQAKSAQHVPAQRALQSQLVSPTAAPERVGNEPAQRAPRGGAGEPVLWLSSPDAGAETAGLAGRRDAHPDA